MYFKLIIDEFQKLQIIPAKLLDEFLGSSCDVAGEVNGVDTLENDVVCLHGVSASEWWSSSEKLKHEDSE